MSSWGIDTDGLNAEQRRSIEVAEKIAEGLYKCVDKNTLVTLAQLLIMRVVREQHPAAKATVFQRIVDAIASRIPLVDFGNVGEVPN